MGSPASTSPYAGHRFPAEVVSHAVRLYFRFPPGLVVGLEAVRRWALKSGQEFADRIHRRLARAGDKRHRDEVAIKIAGRGPGCAAWRHSPRSHRRTSRVPVQTSRRCRRGPATPEGGSFG